MKISTLLLALFSFFLPQLSAQMLEAVGSIPKDLQGSSITVFFEGNCDKRLTPATFSALRDAGFRVHVDGERRPQFGGLVTTVTVSDTTFTRRGENAVVRSIHENTLTDLVLTISGSFTNVSIRNVFLNFVDRKTGELLLTVSCRQRNIALGYQAYSEELYRILSPNS